jgi:hypothetical protein
MARTVKRSITFDPDILRDAEAAAAEATGGNLSAFISQAVLQQVRLQRGRALMRDDRGALGSVDADVLAGVDAEWPA